MKKLSKDYDKFIHYFHVAILFIRKNSQMLKNLYTFLIFLCLINSLSAPNNTSPNSSGDSSKSLFPSFKQAGQTALVSAITFIGVCVLKSLFGCCIRRRIKKKVAQLNIEEFIIDIKKIIEEIVKSTSRATNRQDAQARNYLIATGNAVSELKTASATKIQEIKNSQGVIIISMSCNHPKHQHMNAQTEISHEDLIAISRLFTENQIPHIIIHISEEVRNAGSRRTGGIAVLPVFTLSTMGIPGTQIPKNVSIENPRSYDAQTISHFFQRALSICINEWILATATHPHFEERQTSILRQIFLSHIVPEEELIQLSGI